MDKLVIYHNGTCSKSRSALEILQEQNIPHEVRWYLSEPLTKKELSALLQKLTLQPSEIIRKNEPLYKEQFEGKELSEQEWLDILLENPILIERPIVEKGDKAVVARPPEKLFEII